MPTTLTFAPHYDAVVVGARCAGAATAMLLARHGARVLMIDRDQPGKDTMSTHALMRGAIMQLTSWGLIDRVIQAGAPPVRRTKFFYGDEVADIAIKASHGVDALYAPRRTVLDKILIDAAIDAGVEVRFGVSLAGILRDDRGRVSGAVLKTDRMVMIPVRAGIVIGADGRASPTAHHAGAATERLSEHRSATVYAYFDDLPCDSYLWCYREGLSAGAIPTTGGLTCVFASVPRKRFLADIRGRLDIGLLETVIATHPELGEAAANARIDGRAIGFIGQQGHLRQSAGPGWALVGDAGYFKDPMTAHGITDALRDAEILARAILSGTDEALLDYNRTRDRLSADLFQVTDDIASFAWTLEDLKGHHKRLNQAMKAEQEWMSETFGPVARAA